jgi:integrase
MAICTAAGLEGSRIRDLRHTYASHLASCAPLIGCLLSHTQAATTRRYAHLAEDPLGKRPRSLGYFVGCGKSSQRNHDSNHFLLNSKKNG